MTQGAEPSATSGRGPLPLERQMQEARRYYVCGIIENSVRWDGFGWATTPQRFANVYDANSPEQAEDFAMEEVRNMVHEGRRGNLWVAGVYQLNVDIDGRIGEPAFLNVDRYAKYVNRDLTDEVG